MRIDTVHGARLTAISQSGTVQLTLPAKTMTTAGFAVGDWVDPTTRLVHAVWHEKHCWNALNLAIHRHSW